VGICRDLSSHKTPATDYIEVLDRHDVLVLASDASDGIGFVNRAVESVSGYHRHELLNMKVSELLTPSVAGVNVSRAPAHVPGDASNSPLMVALRTKEGNSVGLQVISHVVIGTTETYMLSRTMTGELASELERRLAHQAFHDTLTDLPNRLLFLDRLEHAFARAQRQQTELIVMLLDLDNFKLINDSLGHAAGDELLVAVARRLAAHVRSSETVARLGGDEFAFLIEGVQSQRELLAVAERIQGIFRDPFELTDTTHYIRMSLGIATAADATSPGDLLRNADTAMYRAKATRKGDFELFDDMMSASVSRQLALTNALQDAVRNRQLTLHYQPVVAINTGELLGVEALLRWSHWQWGRISPSEFIPLAEERGLIATVGLFVLEEVARQAAIWKMRFPNAMPLGILVNTSPHELSQPTYLPSLLKILTDHRLEPTDLSIEITEEAFIDYHDGVLNSNLRRLADLGFRLSLDDFGTGYSALASLHRFPLAMLKIDGYFIRALGTTPDEALVKAIVGLGDSLGLTVIAEGIETEEQLRALEHLGCHAAQGYHLCRPQPANELDAVLRRSGDGFVERLGEDPATRRDEAV
jgi:diguanylate cyclase (GGDEF)-like protein